MSLKILRFFNYKPQNLNPMTAKICQLTAIVWALLHRCGEISTSDRLRATANSAVPEQTPDLEALRAEGERDGAGARGRHEDRCR